MGPESEKKNESSLLSRYCTCGVEFRAGCKRMLSEGVTKSWQSRGDVLLLKRLRVPDYARKLHFFLTK